MPKQTKRNTTAPKPGNYVSEWFGYRTFPKATEDGRDFQAKGTCPFLSEVLAQPHECIKPQTSKGVCSINSPSNGSRQEWLVCPYRALDQSLLEDVTRRLFGLNPAENIFIVPAPNLARAEVSQKFEKHLSRGNRGFVYLQNKLGGEISLAATAKSPELAFDVSIVEIVAKADQFVVGRFGIFETQTMDFHGTYRYVVANLNDALRLHKKGFAQMVAQNQDWLSDRIEGPNIANVFKRTFYQMVLKFQIGMSATASGCAIAIPASVWDSWQKHLACPPLDKQSDGTFLMVPPQKVDRYFSGPPSWIYVFDIDGEAKDTPNPLVVRKVIATNAKIFSHYALEAAPAAVLTSVESSSMMRYLVKNRAALVGDGFWSHDKITSR